MNTNSNSNSQKQKMSPACANCGRHGELRYRADGSAFCRACGHDTRKTTTTTMNIGQAMAKRYQEAKP